MLKYFYCYRDEIPPVTLVIWFLKLRECNGKPAIRNLEIQNAEAKTPLVNLKFTEQLQREPLETSLSAI